MGVTRISYGSNLPVDRAKESLDFLEKKGMIKQINLSGNRGYMITARGGEYLQAHKTVKKFIDENSFE